MRIGFATGLFVRSVILGGTAAITACQTPDFNPGRLESMTLGTLAGVYFRVNGRWPASVDELSHSSCPDFEQFPAADFGESPSALSVQPPAACEFAARFPYVAQFTKVSANLRVSIRDAAGRNICQMTVVAPPVHSSSEIAPLVQIKFPVFGCPGEGKQSR